VVEYRGGWQGRYCHTEHTAKVGVKGTDKNGKSLGEPSRERPFEDEVKEVKVETSNLLEEIARSQEHKTTKEGMSTPPENGPKSWTIDYMSWPPEEESKIQAQAEEAILRGITRGWSNAMRYKFGSQQEISKVSVAGKTAHDYKAVTLLDPCDSIKQAHDMAKAVKANDATVPVHLWDKAIFRGLPSLVEKKV
jgi:hypothetical protein